MALISPDEEVLDDHGPVLPNDFFFNKGQSGGLIQVQRTQLSPRLLNHHLEFDVVVPRDLRWRLADGTDIIGSTASSSCLACHFDSPRLVRPVCVCSGACVAFFMHFYV